MSQEKIVTIYDIAEKLNLSASTISRGLQDHPAINKKTKKKIFETANSMGYRFNTFARNLRSQKTNTIGVIVARLNSYFVSAVLAGIEKVVNGAGYNLLISQSLESEEKEAAYAKTMMHNRVDGLIVALAANTTSLQHFDPFIRHNIPLLFVDRVIDTEQHVKVVIDNFKAGYEVTQHLIDQGCKKIVHITGSLLRNVYNDRKRGYEQALIDNKITLDPNLIIENDLSETAAIEAAQRIMKMKKLPDGIFVSNDFVAAICLITLKHAGIRIPQDIAIAGFNNDVTSRIVDPCLTTVNYPGQEMGEVVAKHLINHLNGTMDINLTNTIILKSELIIRESSLKKNDRKNPL